jgi:UDP-N-acetyl-D-glucosamine dehydrogenase
MAQRDSTLVARESPTLQRNVGIVGLGIVGTATARLAAQAGHRVLGYDANPARAVQVGRELQEPLVEISSVPVVLSSADIIVIAVRAATGPDGTTELRSLASAFRTLADLPTRDRLILVETTVPPGTTRRLAAELPETVQATMHIAHCPERLRVGDSLEQLRKVPRLVGGLTPAATRMGCNFIESLGIPAVPVSQPEVAELAKLVENAFLTTGIAFMGEIARIAHALGVSAAEVADAAETKPHGYYAFRPGPAIGGHCLVNDLHMLRGTASSLGLRSELLQGVEHAADGLNSNVLARLQALLATRNLSLRGALVWIIGVGFKLGSNDSSGSAAIGLVQLLRAHGCSVVFSDSKIGSVTVDDSPVAPAPNESASFRPQAALLLSGDPAIELGDVVARSQVVLDLGGSRIMRGSPCKLERM